MRPVANFSQQQQRPRQGAPGHGGPMGGLGIPVQKAKDFKGTVKRLARYLKPFSLALALIFGLMAVSAVLGTAAPKITGLGISKIFEGAALKLKAPGAAMDFKYIANIIWWLLGIYLINALVSYFAQKQLSVISQKTIYNLRKELNAKLQRLPLKYFDSKPHGELMSRAANDIDNISNTLQQGLPQLISSLIGIIGAIVMMLVISPLLTVITAVTLPLSMAVTMAIAKRSQKYFMSQQQNLGMLNSHIEEMLSGHNVVKAFSYEKGSLKKFSEINARLYESGWRAQWMSTFIFPMMNFISNLGYVAVCVAGGLMVASSKILIGDVQAFVLYVRMFTQPVAQAAGIMNQLQSAVASAERVFEVLDEKEELKEAEAAFENRGGEVGFDSVKFGYTDKLLFEGLSLTAKKGHTVAIVGPTGAGKTTLVNLLMRFYEISGGKITIDGTNICDVKRSELRRRFGMVLQDTWLFNGTIKDNIAYSKPQATEDEIYAAAKAAHADHFVRALPEGYNTMINEDASNLSQGEKQLLTIARAFLADPEILILDEATSSVDTRTEILIQQAMKTLMKDRTSFVIAHRLSTIRDAEVILVMDNGRIVEQGSHKELLGAKGFYSTLYRAQFSGAVTES